MRASDGMADSPKILQVTFGTFSCTLEGFEDPVEALIAVAEYFRGLQERDPGFAGGAILPDGGTLARFARRVRANGPGGGLVEVEEPEGPDDAAGDRQAGTEAPAPDETRLEAMVASLAGEDVREEEARDAPGPEGGDAGPEPEPEEDEEEAHPGLRKLLAAAPNGEDEDALSRIMSRAEDQLADPEAARRREAIASLKAAVAATEAERVLGEIEPGPEEREDPFRDDLREAVQSRGPGAGERPHPAPLRLVASQRVDVPEPPAAGDARPRPVAVEEAPAIPAAAPSPPRPEGSFEVFAAEMGAESLSDLIEAAAAWTCFVGEAEDVSRSQLLKMAAEVLPEAPSREEGLRGFGALLRQGRIVALSGGRYRISPDSRFNPGRLAG